MRYIMSVLALLALTAGQARAQEDAPANRVAVSATIFGGGFLPATNFNDGTRFNNAGTVGGAVTLWPARYLGIRGGLLRTKSDTEVPADSNSPLEYQNPAIWLVSADLVLQPNLPGVARWGWAPYLVGGIGAKHYGLKRYSRYAGYTALAGNLGAGLEYRFGSHWGVQMEAKHLFSRFKEFEYNDNQRDWLLTAGINVRF